MLSQAQICPCGCGLLAPIMAPRFSKICTYLIHSSSPSSSAGVRPGIASAATAVVLAHVAAGTKTLLLGAGGIMLPNHAPLVIAMAVHNGTNVVAQSLIVVALASVASLTVAINASSTATRLMVAFALTCMPILIVYNGTGPWQIDYHMYFFAIFAMLVAYCDRSLSRQP